MIPVVADGESFIQLLASRRMVVKRRNRGEIWYLMRLYIYERKPVSWSSPREVKYLAYDLKKKKKILPLNHLRTSCIHFVQSVVRLMTGPKPLPKQVPHTVRSSTFPLNFQFSHISLRLSSSFLRCLHRLPVTYILPSIFPSITCFRRHFLRKMLQFQLAFPLFIVNNYFLHHSKNYLHYPLSC